MFTNFLGLQLNKMISALRVKNANSKEVTTSAQVVRQEEIGELSQNDDEAENEDAILENESLNEIIEVDEIINEDANSIPWENEPLKITSIVPDGNCLYR